MGKTPQSKGRSYEKDFAKRLGLKTVPGSGNQPFYKLDVEGAKILFSLKHTENKSISLKAADLDEAKDAIYGESGIGPDYTPAMSLQMDGEEYAVLRMDDLVKLLETKPEIFKPSKKNEKRARASVPAILRRAES